MLGYEPAFSRLDTEASGFFVVETFFLVKFDFKFCSLAVTLISGNPSGTCATRNGLDLKGDSTWHRHVAFRSVLLRSLAWLVAGNRKGKRCEAAEERDAIHEPIIVSLTRSKERPTLAQTARMGHAASTPPKRFLMLRIRCGHFRIVCGGSHFFC